MSTRKFHEMIGGLEKNRCEMPVVDAQLHVVDFLQDGDGLKQLIKQMDRAGSRLRLCLDFQ